MIDNMTDWTNVSVIEFAAGKDPIAKMEAIARQVILDAMDKGWQGPPFDPIELAKIMSISIRSNADLADARISWIKDGYVIEYNPHKPRGRANFSIAHEIAHTFFPDCSQKVRNRSCSREEKAQWQLEMLCNLGAAELTMPIELFPSDKITKISIEEIMRLIKEFQVSTEAMLIRLVKLASSRVACFSAARLSTANHTTEYRVDYRIDSSHWKEQPMNRMLPRVRSQILDECVAIGATSKGIEKWDLNGPELHIEAVALPPLTGMDNLRIVGFLRPAAEVPDIKGIEYRQGNAAVFTVEANVAIVHIVNDRAQRWGTRGFAQSLRLKHQNAYDDYTKWRRSNPKQAALGAVRMFNVLDNNRHVASLVAQEGYGVSVEPRIRYEKLNEALQHLRDKLKNTGVNIVQMPRIGTGQAGGNWKIIEELIRKRLVSTGIKVRVIELPPK